MSEAMRLVIEGYRPIYEGDKKPWHLSEIERQFDIEYYKRAIRHGAKKTTGIWKNADYEKLKQEFVEGIRKAYNPKIKEV